MRLRACYFPIALLLAGAGPALGQAPCAPPESMKAQFQDKPNAAAYRSLGLWFAEQKQYDCAANAFATSLQMEPNQKDAPHLAFMFGSSLYLSGDVKESIPALQEAEQLGFRDIKLHAVLASALDAEHSTRDAEAEWREALDWDPELSAALDALSNDLLLDKDYAGVIALLDRPRLVPQRTPQQCLNLAAAFASTGKLNEAANVLRDGLNTAPESTAVADRLASVLVQLNRKDEAVALLNLEVEQHPADADLAAHYLEVLGSADPAKAQDAARKLLLAFPQNAKLFYLGGVLETKTGNPRQARIDLEQSLKLKPDEALAHEALGIVLAQLKDMAGAKEQFERAVALGDNSPEAKANLAKALAALGSGK